MSYDLRIYFPHTTFPAQSWNAVLAQFSGPDCEVRHDGPCGETGVSNSVLSGDDCSPVRIGISALKHHGICEPPGTHWIASIGNGAGRTPSARWLHFAIPYHALILIPGVTVHDCQHHNGVTVDGSSFTDAGSWLEFASGRIWDRRARQLSSMAAPCSPKTENPASKADECRSNVWAA